MAKIDIKDASAWIGKIAEERREAAERGLYSAGLRIVQRIVVDIIPREKHPPVDRGTYRAGWKAMRQDGGKSVLVYNSSPIASIIEDGVKPGAPIGRKMIDALTEWVIRKLGRYRIGGAGSQERTRKRTKGAVDDARGVAWAIAMKRKKSGWAGLHILQKAMVSAPEIVREEVQRAMKNGRRG